MSVNYLPFSLVVDVSIAKNTNFPASKSFQTLLILAVGLTVEIRAKVKEYSSYMEAEQDGATDSVKDILKVVFGQQRRPSSVKVGYIDSTLDIEDEINRLNNIDSNFVFLGLSDETILSDKAKAQSVASWGEANNKFCGFIERNINALDKEKESLTKMLKEMNFNRSFSVFAKTDDEKNNLFGILAFMATRNFSDRNSFYTAKFKSFSGAMATQLTTTEYKNLTGFVQGKGLDKSVGNFGNVFTYLGDRAIFAEGCTASGELISAEHGLLWLDYTLKYEVLNLFTNNDVVPYTDLGVGMLIGVTKMVLDMAVASGLLAEDSVTITADSVLNVPESQRANHIAPLITWDARLAGAIHYTAINGEVKY
jgi:hypothetical protein